MTSTQRRLRRRPAALAGVAAAAALCAPAAAHSQAPVDCTTTSGAYAAGTNCRELDVDGHPRRFIVHMPAGRPRGPLPVVFMFHGSSGSGDQFLRISGWRELADEHGFVAVFPTGLRYRMLDSGRKVTKWNDGELAAQVDLSDRPRGYPPDAPFPADDVGFVDTMLGDLGAHLPVDRRRIYASGFSNGADFTARLAVERATVLAAAGFAAGGLSSVGAPARPIPMAMAVGSRDDRVLAQTGLAELPLDPVGILTQPVLDAKLELHLATLGLDPRFYGAAARPTHTELRWPAAGAGPGGAVFAFAMLAGVTHQYANAGNNPAGLEAAAAFWEFFAAHPRT